MKKIILTLTVLLTLPIHFYLHAQAGVGELKFVADTTEVDPVEYELIIFEIGFDNYLVSQPPKEFYAQHYYRNWNRQYAIEWNNRYRVGPRQELFLWEIDYDYFTDYGIELEYKLYYFFLFFEDKYNLTLVPRARP